MAIGSCAAPERMRTIARMSSDHAPPVFPGDEGGSVAPARATLGAAFSAAGPLGPVVIAKDVDVVAIAGKGRGVVAARAFAAGDVIEVAPVVEVAAADAVDGTALEHYVYDWFGGVAVALGCGSLYNHSYAPNAHYKKCRESRVIEYRALVAIAAGTEILVNYNGDPNDLTPLWFHVV